MSHLYKRGGVWWGRVRAAGREYRRSLRTGNRAEAARRLESWETSLGRIAFGGEARHRWKEAVLKFGEYAAETFEPATLARYRVSLRQVHHIIGDKWLDEIGNKEMAMIAGRPGPSNATRRRDLTAVAAVFRAAIAQGWVETNVAKVWDRDIIKERRDPIALPSYRAIARSIQSAPQMLGRLMLALLQTGMRLEEMAGLRPGNLGLKRGEITLTRTKGRRARVVRLTDSARGTFEGTPRYLATTGEAWVFWHDEGRRYANLSSRLKEIIKRSGGGFRTHDLRHRFAVDYLRFKRGSIYDLQQQMGHASVKTTEIYLAYVGDSEALDDDWPNSIALPDMSYESVMALDLGGTLRGTDITVSHKNAKAGTVSK